jgi:hypothetical protein
VRLRKLTIVTLTIMVTVNTLGNAFMMNSIDLLAMESPIGMDSVLITNLLQINTVDLELVTFETIAII